MCYSILWQYTYMSQLYVLRGYTLTLGEMAGIPAIQYIYMTWLNLCIVMHSIHSMHMNKQV
jgi:hypothetical protein